MASTDQLEVEGVVVVRIAAVLSSTGALASCLLVEVISMQAVAPILDAMVEEVRLGAFRFILATVGLVLGDVSALALLVVPRWRVRLGSAPGVAEWIWQTFVLRQVASGCVVGSARGSVSLGVEVEATILALPVEWLCYFAEHCGRCGSCATGSL